MTRKEMLKTSWRPYMIIHYEPGHGSELCHEMMLLGIEFDDEAVHCVPFDSDNHEHEEFYINIAFVKIPKVNKNTMRIITSKPPKVNDTLQFAQRDHWIKYQNRIQNNSNPSVDKTK